MSQDPTSTAGKILRIELDGRISEGNEDSKEVMIQKPLIHSGEDIWAPSGIAFANQGPWEGKLLVATLRGQQLLAISLNGKGTVVKNVESWLRNGYGRLREIIHGKGGSIYLTTSKRDGRGNPDIGYDKIIHLIPK